MQSPFLNPNGYALMGTLRRSSVSQPRLPTISTK